ncbi:dynein heavy chain [Gaertneriomyces semiglobifer]|nr:dynein heavy chain [Gaertneriomyces semiglobifer]
MEEPKEDGAQTPPDTQVADPRQLLKHLESLISVVLDADAADTTIQLSSNEGAVEKATKFCGDPQIQVLYVVKEREDTTDKDEDGESLCTITVQLEMTFSSRLVASLAVIKRYPTVEATKALQQQLQVINLPGPGDGANPYEALHSYIHNAVSPFFEAFAAAKASAAASDRMGREDKDFKTGVPVAKKKIAELELSLLQLQQNVDIPEVILQFNPLVLRAVETCRAHNRRITVDAIGDIANDSAFLNKLQSDMNGWKKEIQRVTKLSRDPSTGTALQEINFWTNLEKELDAIEKKLKSEEVVLTLDILKHAKRFHATVSFLADTGLKDAMEKAQKYNILMNQFPLNDLLSATDLAGINSALSAIFGHLTKKLKLSPYPIRRALPFVESISRDVNEQLVRILGRRRLMYMNYDEFEKAMSGCEDVFRTWDDQVKEFTNVARDVTRKRSEPFLPIKINPVHKDLQDWIKFLRNFRRQHEQLYETIVKVMRAEKVGHIGGTSSGSRTVSLSDTNALEDIRQAYDAVKNVDVLDVSPEGRESWVAGESLYNEKVSHVENQIIARLRDRLGTAKNANEMFRVFSKFNALFVRPKIRGAIQEYQAQLIESVKEDIRRLQDKFRIQYRNSEAFIFSSARDVPPVAGAITWARQIEHQLGLYMKRVEDVLGTDWGLHAEGQKLQIESSSFKKKLETRPMFDAWVADIMKKDLAVSGRIFDINRRRARGNILQLSINFDGQTITLFKEVRNLVTLNFPVPHSISSVAKDAKRVYPFAVSLTETVRTYTNALAKLDEQPDVGPLVAGYHRDVQKQVSRGIQLRWDYFANNALDVRSDNRHVVFVRDFATVVSNFQDKVNSAIAVSSDITNNIGELSSCAFDRDVFDGILKKIQSAIDRLNLEGYANLNTWTTSVHARIEATFILRLEGAIKSWTTEFLHEPDEGGHVDNKRRRLLKSGMGSVRSMASLATTAMEQKPGFEQIVHEITLKNQVMFLNPPIEEARKVWYGRLHRWLGNICSLRPIQSSSYEMNMARQAPASKKNYASLLGKVRDSLAVCYATVENRIDEVQKYMALWLQYQSLWDLESHFVYEHLGNDLKLWQQLVLEIKKARSTFDNSETEKSFGPIIVDYEQVQSKVNAKYDQWQREIVNRFGANLGSAMRTFHAHIAKQRNELEQYYNESASTGETVSFITFVQGLKRNVPQWSDQVQAFRSSQKVLERQRYQFPNDWLYVDNVEGEWGAFADILGRKDKAIQDQIAPLQAKIIAEDKAVEQKMKDLVAEWEKKKPLKGDIKPSDALGLLNIFEGRLTRLKDDYEQIRSAKDILALDRGGDSKLHSVLEELRDLKGVWGALSQLWAEIDEIRDILWSVAVPRKIRQSLDQLLARTKEMPSRMRQYAAFDFAQDMLKSYLKVNTLVGELKSEAMRERHWKQLFKHLRLEGKITFMELTVGQLWDTDLTKNEPIIKDISTVAQGEMALEAFLRQLKETWSAFSLELVVYQNKCRLIRGWDDLFTKCSENINSLSAMKHSPYFKVFEEEALAWEDKLNRIHALFDIWIDVQRQWVYLEGIFSASADIKHLLPVETSRFHSINAEFMSLMKKVYKSPLVLDILGIAGIQKSMERLADLLSKVQRALGDYLERERSSFPRFYFVGDEDLLDLIGNGKDIGKVQKHLRKMFAGIASVLLNEDGSAIVGFSSRERESVDLKRPILLKDNSHVNAWLGALENEMRATLASLLSDAISEISGLHEGSAFEPAKFSEWMNKYPDQLIILSMQVLWTQSVEKALSGGKKLATVQGVIENGLEILASLVLQKLPTVRRKKCEHLITELVHQRDVIRNLIRAHTQSVDDFQWLYHMRYYFRAVADPAECLTIAMADATFIYGFEYLGVADRLVQTPLTDRCYLTLTQALHSRLGGSPFGPAGTGKTESVKALGAQLGRFVLVFCCDENFDFQAMGRIFIGLCRVGAWGCFDEFNRLEERILSAVSQQIQTIQLGLKRDAEIELVNKQFKVNRDTGIFITMNPGYAGRSNLPDNLKKLFRSVAMTKPDKELIAQVMLYSQGFRTAEELASKVVPLFVLCNEQLSPQDHYDFGLRSLKSVLTSAGNLKREELQMSGASTGGHGDSLFEQKLLIRSIRETVMPKLVSDDIKLLQGLLDDVFPGVHYVPVDLKVLKEALKAVCLERRLVADGPWLDKVIQLYQIQEIHHGLMMVGPSGSGKSMAHRVLLEALHRVEGIEGLSYVIDPKAMSKEILYGHMDPTTREWTDGLFTHIMRKIVDNVRGEATKRHWIIFDGDVDPEWVENLNSVLDDNKLLTLPNGERLSLPPNVRIMFEVEDLKQATLATVSRCGMVWFSEETVGVELLVHNYLETLRTVILSDIDEYPAFADKGAVVDPSATESPVVEAQRMIAEILAPHLKAGGSVMRALDFAASLEHIMDFTRIQALSSFFTLLNSTVRIALQYNDAHPDFPLSLSQLETYVSKRMCLAIVWSFAGSSRLETRRKLGQFLHGSLAIDFPPDDRSVIDFDVDVATGAWVDWVARVPTVEIETHNVGAADVVIPTLDTLRHEEVLYSWLSEHRPLVLCGPPGSGKTMTLFSALRKLPGMEVVGLNFSSATTPDLILRTLEQYCEYRKTPHGIILSPRTTGPWLVLFCDEINLPARDKYGTQRVISFIRQLVEYGGFWRSSDKAWVHLERIQFVGACNPPTDPGRVPLSHRFLRHAPVIMVDYPGENSLLQIYNTFARAMLKVVPSLRGYAEPLTAAMVEFYRASQSRFTPDIQAHYVYSPRELTRWMRGIFEAIKPVEDLPLEGLVRIWAHEALRLFQDRLVTPDERQWTDTMLDSVALKHFPGIDPRASLARPILFSNWLSKHYTSVQQKELREYVRARLKDFYEEELDVPLVLFNDVLEHVLRIDRVYRQMQGHLLLIGVSGSGKTTLSRFVAWMNGLAVFQIEVHNKYSAADFDEDLRTVLRRAGCKGEKICFIMDESNVLDSGFLEKMNTLLANAEIPGLFEGDDYLALMSACKESAQRNGLMLDTPEELHKWFTTQVMANLHVVFTMNPPAGGLASRAATSPALFNRCVLDWFGDWSDQALFQVGKEFTHALDLDKPSYHAPVDFPMAYQELSLPPLYRDAVVNAFVYVHKSLQEANQKLFRREGKHFHITPRHYLDFINHYVNLFREKREDLEDRQRHLNVGLEKLEETVLKVEELRKSLAVKRAELEAKTSEANEKLGKMLRDQKEAEAQQRSSLEIQEDIARQDREIAERAEVVKHDLAEAEPAVAEAQNSVSSIKKQHLQEVRTMGNPPEMVKLAMESVCILLGHKVDTWKTVQTIIRRDDFIPSIINYDTEKMSARVRDEVERTYLSNPKYNFEAVNRASQACGPLVQWVIAQVKYASILERVGPLREEVKQLEESARVTKRKGDAIQQMVKDLENSIARYKEEYAVLISQTQALKSEMENVQIKVERSLRLLENLSSEKERWESGSQSFESQMATVVGDVLLSSAFLAYAGYFGQMDREMLMRKWAAHLSSASIQFRRELSVPDYLSIADERLAWQANSLPSDRLCTENAIVLKRFNRYPLLIDPAGQATAFLLSEYKHRKLMVTSFLDDSFIKVLESALRFGNPLLVQDVEYMDPILNPVLNKEVRRAGGRVLIRLGGQDIDFSPSFTLFLSTRDPSMSFSPDLSSRVTFVNFTITRESLQSQCLHKVLRAERPDTDSKRTDLLKLQGEFQLRLRHLEHSLLQALNSSKGNILDDDTVIATLETLKQEAAEITRKVEETDLIMQEVESVTALYTPLAQACSAIFFVLEQLNVINRFYQFSLAFFLDIFHCVLHKNPSLNQLRDPTQRLEILESDIFHVTFRRTSRALIHDDQITLAVMLAHIKTRGSSNGVSDRELRFLVGDNGITSSEKLALMSSKISHLFGDDVSRKIAECAQVPAFSGLATHMETNPEVWSTFRSAITPELQVPQWNDGTDRVSSAFRNLIVLKCLRPDRVVPAMSIFIQSVFGETFLSNTDVDLKAITMEEITEPIPIVFCSVPGTDASYRVENLATETSSRMTSVAMGSAEGFTLAETAINSAVKNGTWVLLKNVHLAPSWLSQLEKRLNGLKTNPSFRLFLTMELNPKVPVNLLRASRILMFEPLPGLKANVNQSLTSIPISRLKPPSERVRLYFLLAWLHAVVQERLRYVPLGWSKLYEFNDSDQDMAFNVIDTWMDKVSQGRANIPPERIPWEALRILLKQTVYGGKIDNHFDQKVLDSFVDRLFTPQSYELNHPLVNEADGIPGVPMPDGIRLDQFVQWINRMPDQQPPTWLGLPNNAEVLRMTLSGSAILKNVKKLRSATDEDEVDVASADFGRDHTSTRPVWMKTLHTIVSTWLKILPPTITCMPTGSKDVRDSLRQFFEREHKLGRELLSIIRSDLTDLQGMCEGTQKCTNHLRALSDALTNGSMPADWLRYKVPGTILPNEWVADFVKRLEQLQKIATSQTQVLPTIWLGGLFMPEAFVSATRQAAAHVRDCSLEELELEVSVLPSGRTDGAETVGFPLSGLRLEGATWTDTGLMFTTEASPLLSTPIPISLKWIDRKEAASRTVPGTHQVTLPVYLNDDRQDLLFTAPLMVKDATDTLKLIQRSVAIVASSL